MARLGPRASIPALVAHPDAGWDRGGAAATPRPVMLWFHGRTVSKELDPGRYLRWLRAPGATPGSAAGFAVCAVDLPGHGERFDPAMQEPSRTLDVVAAAVDEIDAILDDLSSARWNGVFDLARVGIGGMSAGGMVTLVRLCAPNPFKCAAVEATSGAFGFMVERGLYEPAAAARLEPLRRLAGWRPVPLLALHSEADQWVPVSSMRSFLTALAGRYREAGADPSLIEFKTWESTGAPNEHYGFGRVSNEAKSVQLEFLIKALGDGGKR